MSLIETNLPTLVKRQYFYKLKAHARIYLSLIAVQLLACFISQGGNSSSTFNNQGLVLRVKDINGDTIVFLTLLWAFCIGISLANNIFKMDFALVSNRLSSHLSSLGVLLTAAFIGGITATLSGLALRLSVLFFSQEAVIDVGSTLWIAPSVLFLASWAAILYAAFLAALGYLIGMISRLYPAVFFSLLALGFGLMFVRIRFFLASDLLANAFLFFGNVMIFFLQEISPLLLTLKILLGIAVVLACLAVFFNRTEVK